MSLDQKAQILEAAVSAPCGVRDAVNILRRKTSTVISMLKKMETERLLELRQVAASRRGRPKKNIVCTSLGFEFLEAYRKLKMKPLRARKEDLNRAVKDALYTKRLVSNGHSSFRLFMELNMIARNIKISSETSEAL